MASFLYYSFGEDLAEGNIDVDADTFRVMLVTTGYVPSKAHTKRSDVVANEVSGTGYTAGGPTTTLAATRLNGVTSISATSPTLAAPVSGFTAAYGVIYKSRGGAASADELVALIDPALGPQTANGTSFTISITGAATITVPA